MIEEGPMKEHIERSKEGVLKEEYITYRIKDGMLVVETSVRTHTKNKRGDYTDSYTSEPITEVKDET